MNKNTNPWDRQVGGGHYVLPIQPFEYSMKNKLDPMQHTIIKYTTRFREKNGKEDLLKAIHVLELLIEHEYGKDSKAGTARPGTSEGLVG